MIPKKPEPPGVGFNLAFKSPNFFSLHSPCNEAEGSRLLRSSDRSSSRRTLIDMTMLDDEEIMHKRIRTIDEVISSIRRDAPRSRDEGARREKEESEKSEDEEEEEEEELEMLQ